MARNNSPARRAERAEAAAFRQSSAAPVLVDEQPVAATLSDRVIRRLCWRARGWAWKASWQ